MTRRLLFQLVVLLAAAPAAAVDLVLLRTYDGQAPQGQFGLATAVVGDMDGDGFAEFAIGASTDPAGGPSAGRVFVFRGGDANLAAPPAWLITGLPGDLLGFSLAPAGDQDGDGLADLLIGAPGSSDIAPNAPGRVLIAFGSTPLGMRAPLAISGNNAGDRFGHAVALVDLDGDRDIAVGAPGANSGNGIVRVFHGGAAPVPLFTLHGRDFGDEFGTAVAGVGRTRGPAAPKDMVIGAPYNSDFEIWAGATYLYFGGAVPDTVPDRVWRGAEAADLFGSAVAGAGDVNGDGRADVLVGAPGANGDTLLVDAGRAYLYLGAPVPPMAPAMSVLGSRAFGELGLRVAGIGDVDGDGRGDFAIAMPGSPDAFTPGEVRIFLGRPVPVPTADTVLVGEAVDDMFGHSISNGGKIRGGTRDLFLIGSDEHGGVGRAYLYGSAPTVGVPGPAAGGGRRLAPPWPNPAAGRARFAVALDRPARVRLEVVDVNGRSVATVVERDLAAGRHSFEWPAPGSGERPGAGVYWAIVSADGAREGRRFVLLGR